MLRTSCLTFEGGFGEDEDEINRELLFDFMEKVGLIGKTRHYFRSFRNESMEERRKKSEKNKSKMSSITLFI